MTSALQVNQENSKHFCKIKDLENQQMHLHILLIIKKVNYKLRYAHKYVNRTFIICLSDSKGLHKLNRCIKKTGTWGQVQRKSA